jgi:hypothetical protein
LSALGGPVMGLRLKSGLLSMPLGQKSTSPTKVLHLLSNQELPAHTNRRLQPVLMLETGWEEPFLRSCRVLLRDAGGRARY